MQADGGTFGLHIVSLRFETEPQYPVEIFETVVWFHAQKIFGRNDCNFAHTVESKEARGDVPRLSESFDSY